MSNNLDLPQIAGNQNQKEVTANDQAGDLDAALTEVLAVDMSGGNVTLTATQFRRNMCFAVFGQTASRDLTIAAVKRGIFIVENTDATYPVVVKKGSTSITVDPLDAAIFKTDGTTNDLATVGQSRQPDGTIPYDLLMQKLGVPANAELIVRAVFDRSVTFPIGLTGSQGNAGVASTGNVSFDIQKNGVSKGSVVFNASATATFTFTNLTTFAAGDILTLIAPGTADATLADISITLKGTR
jgi:hypothetical protein